MIDTAGRLQNKDLMAELEKIVESSKNWTTRRRMPRCW